jgi:probable F420-dependent oxidoreductase
MTMKVGWHLPCSVTKVSARQMRESAVEGEAVGFDSLWTNEHIVVPALISSRYPFSDDGRLHAEPTSPYLEPLSTLAFVAGVTSRVELGVSVAVAALRHPLLMAKTASTVDVLSDGRLILGLGAGWLREEFDALDVPFDRRGRLFDEHLAILRDAWAHPTISADRDVYRFGEMGVAPLPVRPGGPPIWIGAGKTKVALRRTVQFADAVHMVPRDPHALEEILDIRAALEAACAAVGRAQPPLLTVRARVRLTGYGEPGGWGVLAGSPERIAETLAAYADAGVAHFVFDARDVGYENMLRSMAPIAEALRAVELCGAGRSPTG